MSFAQALPDAITFSEVAGTGTLTDSTFNAKNLSLTTTDPASKMSIDANACSFGASADALKSYTHRLKTGGRSNDANNPTQNFLTLTAAEAGQLVLAVRTGSNSATDRNLVIRQNGAELYNKVITEDSLKVTEGEPNYYHYVTVNVEAGTIVLTYPVNGLNFYSFELKSAAAPALKAVATVEKLWSGEPLGWSVTGTRQWTGFGEYVYWNSKDEHAIYGTKDGQKVDTILINDAIDGVAFCVDGAGNFVVEGTFPSTASHIFLVKHDASQYVDIPVVGLGRTDIATATGDVFSADGGVVFLYGNSVSLLAVAIKNAGSNEQEVAVKTIAITGSNVQNFVVAGDTTVQYVMRRSTGQTGFDKYNNGVNEGSLEGMTGYKASTLGGAMVTLAGKEYAIYPSGTTNYSSEFSVVNLTDGGLVADKTDATKTVFCANTITRANGTNVGVYVNATKIDDNNAYIQVGNGSDGTALFKLSVSVAAEVTLTCDENMGTVSGAGDFAVGANATVVATPNPGYEFVAWKKGETVVSNDASYSFAVNENTTLVAVFEAKSNVTLILSVNDATMGSITLPEGIVLGENSVVYGTSVALTAVPVEGATFAGWFSGDLLYSPEYTLNLNGKDSLNLTAEFVNVLTLSYELNGGVITEYDWKTKGEVLLDFQNDINEAMGKNFTWVKEENGKIFYNLNGTWTPENDAVGTVCTITGFVQQTTYNTADWLKTFINTTQADKYIWLKEVMIAARTASGLSVADADMVENVYRKEISAFFLNSPADDSWPASASFESMGTQEAFLPIWKHGFANPTEVTAEFTLNAPYKEGFTFDGWFMTEDFSGAKVTSVSPESVIPGNKLYAKWVEYIPSLAEVTAMASDTETKARGVVTYINGRNVYVQDASAGMLLYMKAAPTFQVGQLVTVQGKKTLYGGAPELSNVEEVSAEAGTMPVAQVFATIGALTAEPLKYFGQRVSLKGLRITSYDANGNAYVSDGIDTVQCYKMTPDQSVFPVGTKVSLTAIAGYYNKFQFVGDVAGFEVAGAAGHDDYSYPVRGAEGDFEGYKLENDWIFSSVLDNYAENLPAPADNARGMAVKDGIMYFINRATKSFTRVNGATGVMMDPLPITGEHLFEAQNDEGSWAASVTLAYNDVKLDDAGNALIGACITGGQRFQIYKVDLTTGAAVEVINERLYDDTTYAKINLRFDAFGVYGDVNNDAIIMACNANGWNAFRWEIKGGVAGKAQLVNLNADGSVPSLMTEEVTIEGNTQIIWTTDNPGTAPQIFPLEGGMFYVDGWSTLPMLFDEGEESMMQKNTYESYLLDDFANVPTGLKVGNNDGDTCILNQGHNGLCEFQVGNEYFLVMAATNTVGTPNSAFVLYKYKDAGKAFEDMEPMWYFPAAGMGALTNGCRTAVPSVEVEGNVAKIYVYTNNNGYALYTFTGKAGADAVDNIKALDKAQKVIENGQVYIIRGGVKYTVTGVQVK